MPSDRYIEIVLAMAEQLIAEIAAMPREHPTPTAARKEDGRG